VSTVWIVCGAGDWWVGARSRDQRPGNRGLEEGTEEGENIEFRTLNFEPRSTEENPDVRRERTAEQHVPCA